MYIQRTSLYPTFDKIFELRALLEERVKARQAQGITIGLQEQLFGPEGPAFTVVIRHDDLGGVERLRRQMITDPEFQAFLAKVGAVSRAPAKMELFEVLMPFPP